MALPDRPVERHRGRLGGQDHRHPRGLTDLPTRGRPVPSGRPRARPAPPKQGRPDVRRLVQPPGAALRPARRPAPGAQGARRPGGAHRGRRRLRRRQRRDRLVAGPGGLDLRHRGRVVHGAAAATGWFPRQGVYDIQTLLVGSLLVTVIAMVVAVPARARRGDLPLGVRPPRVRRSSSRSSRCSPASPASCSASSPDIHLAVDRPAASPTPGCSASRRPGIGVGSSRSR